MVDGLSSVTFTVRQFTVAVVRKTCTSLWQRHVVSMREPVSDRTAATRAASARKRLSCPDLRLRRIVWVRLTAARSTIWTTQTPNLKGMLLKESFRRLQLNPA